MTTKHTPGPWELDKWMVAGKLTEVTIGGPIGDEHICTMDGNENNEANARLIAAAPELLAVLKKADAAAWGDYSWIDEARAAIAKAEGR